MSVGGDILDPAMHERRTVGGFALAGTAVGGVVLAHWLAYVLAIPAAHVRAGVLAASGHSYWVLGGKLAVVLGLAAFGTAFIRHVGRVAPGGEAGPDAFSPIATRPILLQALPFTSN